MNRKNKIIFISNFRMHPRYYSYVTKGFNDTYVSTLKIYNKRGKKKILYFLIKFFILTLSIWILQCSNNWDSCKSWNYKNKLNNISDLGYGRSLAECSDTTKQTKSELKFCEQQDMIEEHLEVWDKQSQIDENVDVEQGSEIETKEKNKKVKFKERILDKCKNNLKLASLFLSISLLLSSFSLYLVEIFTDEYIENIKLFLFTLSFLITSTVLTYERIEIKYKNKS
ncbi:fam-h protein [Plasmodium relictum]|uniref:Fam-h protein n=1 Tax=Plasmodium relictum TaxID=85471 RepID=A0A1J1GJW1_PLARL|nr:fam-h protein [Plasmodium relictum]CRG84083.1 fam-h protein [Plasmodium relictum]